MAFFDKFVDKEKLSSITVRNPRQLFSEILRQTSGSSMTREVKFDIFYQIIAFKGIVDGVGASTLVANTALAIADLGLTVCVIDTSILYPVQDLLLKTDYEDMEKDKRLDWFDMPFTKRSVLHVSKLSTRISVLSFAGKNRGITDILSTNDNASLVEIALTELHDKFDIILIDSCSELTTINTTAMQMSNQVIQVWNDTPTVINSIDNFITNQVTLACSLDKMRYVVFSKCNPDVMGDLEGPLKQYRLRKLAETSIAREVNSVCCMNKSLYQFASRDKYIEEYTEAVIRIALHILNVKLEDTPMGNFTANDIVNGKVDGTVHKKLQEQAANMPNIAVNMQQANMQMQQAWGVQPNMPMQNNMQMQQNANFQQNNMSVKPPQLNIQPNIQQNVQPNVQPVQNVQQQVNVQPQVNLNKPGVGGQGQQNKMPMLNNVANSQIGSSINSYNGNQVRREIADNVHEQNVRVV